MNPAEYGRMHALETRYWWFVGRRAIVARLLGDALPDDAPQLLDIGCGTGANLPMLRQNVGKNGQVFGLDYSPLALQFAAEQLNVESAPNLHLFQGDALHLPARDETFDAVTMLDVLEHLSDDKLALSEIYRVLRPNGVLVLSVPAYQHLWSAHDEALHHFRRYEKAGLTRVLRQNGFQTEKLSFAMSLMPPLAWFWRRFVLPAKPRRPRDATRHSQGAVLPMVPDWANRLLIKYVETEGRMIAHRPLKFGTSLVAVARKK